MLQQLRVVTACIFLLIGPTALAADYPSRPIRLVVPYAPAGTADIIARIVGQKVGEAWGQRVVVDNRGGANGNIGSDIVAKADADGYTLLLGTSGSNAVNPSLYADMPYDAKRDLAFIAPIASTANILVSNPGFQAVNLRQFIDLAKAKRATLTYGSSGTGSVLHLSGELLKTLAGIDIVHVPYKGTGPSLVDLLGGQIDVVFANLPAIVPQVKTGRLRGLAVTTATRASALPEVPTMIEGGVPNYDVSSWFGIFIQTRAPKSIVETINREVQRIIQSPETKARLIELGAEPIVMSSTDANRYFHSEIDKWANVVKSSGAKAN